MLKEKHERNIFTSFFSTIRQLFIAPLNLLQQNYCSIKEVKTGYYNSLAVANSKVKKPERKNDNKGKT